MTRVTALWIFALVSAGISGIALFWAADAKQETEDLQDEVKDLKKRFNNGTPSA